MNCIASHLVDNQAEFTRHIAEIESSLAEVESRLAKVESRLAKVESRRAEVESRLAEATAGRHGLTEVDEDAGVVSELAPGAERHHHAGDVIVSRVGQRL